ncbi:MAG: AMP-binding protein [Verrucomicrobiae bacterium]|nr:AMP-binding protein [Verrucomicrobiae bacterium]
MSVVNDALPPDALPDERHLPNRVVRHALGYPERLNVCEALLDANLRAGRAGRPVVHYSGKTRTYGVLANRVNRLANALSANGLKPGDRILIHLPNTPEFIESWLASLRIGAVVVAPVPLLKRRELKYIVAETEPSFVVTTAQMLHLFDGFPTDKLHRLTVGLPASYALGFESFLELGSGERAAVATTTEDVALIAYTSGSTGHPKGTVHTHGDVLAIADSYAREVLSPNQDDVFGSHAFLGFTYGLGASLVFPLRFGASVALDSAGFDPERCLDAISRMGITRLFTTPTACRLLLNSNAGTKRSVWRHVRSVVSAGQHLPKSTFEDWQEATGLDILDGCGSTEMLHIWISQRSGEAEGGCTGRPVDLYEARLLDANLREIRDREAEGSIALRGPTGCRYWKQPKLQAETVLDGWTLSGDRFRRDGAGRYWHVGRTDDLINSGGYKIAPAEVEDALCRHPAVLEACVVKTADSVRGEIVAAFVRLRSPWTANDQLRSNILACVRREIAEYKCPQRLQFISEFPLTSTGKVQRQAMKPPCFDQLQSEMSSSSQRSVTVRS